MGPASHRWRHQRRACTSEPEPPVTPIHDSDRYARPNRGSGPGLGAVGRLPGDAGHLPPSGWPVHAGTLLTRWWRLLDGERVWGSIDVSLTSHGFRSYRLVVFPPGITQTERRCLRMWRAWPTWGLLGWLLLVICAASVLPRWTAVACSALVYLAGGAVTFVLAARTRSHVRTLSVVRIRGRIDAQSAATYAQLETLAAVLAQADARYGQGHLTAVDHEVAWWHVYQCLSASRTGPTQ